MNQIKRLCIDNICMSSRIHIELVLNKQKYQTRVKCIWKWRHLNIPLKYLKSLVKSFFNSLKFNYCFACNLNHIKYASVFLFIYKFQMNWIGCLCFFHRILIILKLFILSFLHLGYPMNYTLDSRFSFNDHTILSMVVNFKEVHPFPNCITSVNVSVLE